MTFSWTFGKLFATQFSNLHEHDQDKVLAFTETYETHGLSDFKAYQGKIAPSWGGLDLSVDDYEYARSNDLWHYHVGIPAYTTNHSEYDTSDWLLHFQWPDKGDSIHIVDLYSHYKYDGGFYLPPNVQLD